MYELPLQLKVSEMIMNQIKMQDEQILQVVRAVGVDVNKDELIRAITYDRQQYKKGYEDGVRDIIERLKKRSMYDFYAHGVSYSNEFLDSLLMEAICGTLKDGERRCEE